MEEKALQLLQLVIEPQFTGLAGHDEGKVYVVWLEGQELVAKLMQLPTVLLALPEHHTQALCVAQLEQPEYKLQLLDCRLRPPEESLDILKACVPSLAFNGITWRASRLKSPTPSDSAATMEEAAEAAITSANISALKRSGRALPHK